MNPEECLEVLKESYQNKFVTFVDILGFRAKVLDSRNDPQQIGNLVHLFKEIAGKPRGGRCASMDCICFSDCIVRATEIISPNDGCDLMEIFLHEVRDLAHAQLAALVMGFFLRGGLSLGDVYISGNRVFGPALIDAYEIESKLAKAPMIMISDDIIASLGDRITEDDAVGQDDDGRYFVDYLSFQRSVVDQKTWIGDLEKHKVKSERAYSEWTNLDDDKERHKRKHFIKWLARYQERILDNYFPTRSDLKISIR